MGVACIVSAQARRVDAFCVDYCKLSAVRVNDTYPLPRMDECLDSLGDTKDFSTLDEIDGYCQMPIPEYDRDKNTFSCHFGIYQFSRMPFGRTNARQRRFRGPWI